MSELPESPPQSSNTRFAEVVRQLRSDRLRLQQLLGERGLPVAGAAWSPSFLCVALFRLSRYLFVNEHRIAARLIWQFNMFATGADISPISRLGDGLVVVHPVAATIYGSAGRCLTVEGLGGLGGGLALDDIGAGPGLPVLGNNVHLARGASILGPVQIGNDVRIGPGCTVVRSLLDGTEVLAHPVSVRQPTPSVADAEHDRT